MINIIENIIIKFKNIIKEFKNNLIKIQGNKLNSNILYNIKIKYNNKKIYLNKISNIFVIDEKTLSIIPYEKNIINNIKKTLNYNKFNFNYIKKKNTFYIKIPKLNNEFKNIIINNLKKYTEEKKINIRNERRIFKNKINKEKYSLNEINNIKNKLDKLTKKYIEKIDFFFKIKKKEILNN
ncbi:putative ribosome recycling factor [Candidatus Zinderia insecticola CARI]|uniref:Putative ribosome recycling factor n=1 Tax=Zinderia insecticola (strain CARI) TaxID=871271 RepID=E0TIQ3_ZINIC|nr:putative ribosome recycling factor [Candidatus Zinderia insecticola CARI]